MSEFKPGHHPETPELRVEHEKRAVARTFVFQSADSNKLHEKIKAQVAKTQESWAKIIGQTPLTHCLWLEKDTSSRNPGQITPIGGGQDPADHGSFIRTALRELLQETHLRPTEIHQLVSEHTREPIKITYHMAEKKPGYRREVDNTQHLFWARILPSDLPYQLDKTEDKIAAFHTLTLDEMGLLWGEDTLDYDGKKLSLLDSLRIFPKNVENEKIDVQFNQNEVEHATMIAETMRSLGTVARKIEIEKLQDVAAELYEILKWKIPVSGPYDQELENTLQSLRNNDQDLAMARDHYAHFVSLCEKSGLNLEEWFAHAVERSNTKIELRNPGNSDIEAALRLALLLTESKLNLQELSDLKREVDMRHGPPRPVDPYHNILGFAGPNESPDFIGFLGKLAKLSDPTTTDYSEEAILQNVTNLDKKTFEARFTELTGISHIGTKFNRINKFINRLLSSEIAQSEISSELTDGTIEPISNAVNADLRTLVRFAFDPDNSPLEDKDLHKRLQFEAFRKLFLLYTLEPASRRYAEAEETHNTDIEDLWGQILTFKAGRDHVINVTDSRGANHDHTMRTFTNIPGLLAQQNVRNKELPSYFRKIIVRGFDNPYEVWDLYGRSLELAADPTADASTQTALFTRTDTSITTHRLSKDGSEVIPVTEIVNEYPAVIKIIETLQNKGAYILDYDPTNKPGTNFNSSGPGGGDPIVLAKFYVMIEVDGVRHIEEVQVFSPTEAGISSFEHKEDKKRFDSQYAIKRLTDTKGLRSFIELMLPAAIYGTPIRTIHRKRPNGKKNT